MTEFLHGNLEYLLALLILLGRFGDVRSTRMISPALKLEANPVAKRFIFLPSILLPVLGTIRRAAQELPPVAGEPV
jgi:hypothetical protein